MRVVSRRDLARVLASRGISPELRSWRDRSGISRLLVREAELDLVDSGPHKRLALPAEETALKLRIGDRPALGQYVADVLAAAGATATYAAIEPGAYWLNNRGYAAYLGRVPDAQRVGRYLRTVGLTDRFRGGFLIQAREFDTVVPLLASQAYCGAPDVLFAAADRPLTILACREFDVHVETRDSILADEAARIGEHRGLQIVRSEE